MMWRLIIFLFKLDRMVIERVFQPVINITHLPPTPVGLFWMAGGIFLFLMSALFHMLASEILAACAHACIALVWVPNYVYMSKFGTNFIQRTGTIWFALAMLPR